MLLLLRSRWIILPLLAVLCAHALSCSLASAQYANTPPTYGYEREPPTIQHREQYSRDLERQRQLEASVQEEEGTSTALEAESSNLFGGLVSFLFNGGAYSDAVPKEALRGPKRFFLFACVCALLFLALKKTVQGIEEHDGRPVRVVLQRSGGRCVGKSFPRQSCQTLGQLKRLISESVENAEKEDQTVVFNGRELTDDSMALAECLPGVTGDELWLDQRVYPNHWSLLNLKQPKRKVKLVSWGFCKSYDMENVVFAFLTCLILSILGSF